MAVTLVDLRVQRADADSLTGWASSASIELFTANPPPVEESGHIGAVVSNTRAYVVHQASAVDLSSTLIYVWFLPGPAMASKANDGFGIVLGDGSNRIQFEVGGNDESAFRHDTGNPPYVCMAIDTAALPRGFAHSGSVGALNLSAITEIGSGCQTTLKAVGGVANTFTDVVRYGNTGLRVTGGTGGDPGRFAEIAELDASTASGRAHGVVRRLGAGLFGLQGPLVFGDTGTGSSVFDDTDAVIVFEARGFAADKYRVDVVGGASWDTTFKLTRVTLIAPVGVDARFDAGSVDVNVCDLDLCTIDGFTEGVAFAAHHKFRNGRILSSGMVEANGADFRNTGIIDSTAAVAMLWNANVDTDGKLDDVSFTSGGSGHALELGPDTPSEITFRRVAFSGYGADGTANAALRNNSGKTITVNIVEGAQPTVINEGSSDTIFQTDPRSLTFTVQTPAGDPLTGYEWRLYEDDPNQATPRVELAGEEFATSATQVYSYTYVADVDVLLQILHPEYVEESVFLVLANANQNINVGLTPEENT